MTQEERLEKIENGTAEWEDLDWLVALAKVHIAALEKVINIRYDPVVTLDIVNKALEWGG